METFYDITNKTKVSADININGQIGKSYWEDTDQIWAAKFQKDLMALGDKIDTLNVFINSPGGEVWDGIAIMNMLKEHPATVNVHVRGLAASIASVIAMAGDNVTMAKSAMMMIHDPSTYAGGNATHLRKVANRLDKAKKAITAAYKSRSLTIDDAKLSQMCTDETWMDAEEALEYGFIDEITGDDAKIDNIMTMSMMHSFDRIPGQMVALATSTPVKPVKKPVESKAALLQKEPKMEITETAALTQDQVDASIKNALAIQAADNRKAYEKETFINGLDELVVAGKLLPADKERHQAMADALAGQTIKVGESTEPALKNYLANLKALPVNGLANGNKGVAEQVGTGTPNASQVAEGAFAVDLATVPKNVDTESFIVHAWVAKQMKAKGFDAANLKTGEAKKLYRELSYRAEGEDEVKAVFKTAGLRQ